VARPLAGPGGGRPRPATPAKAGLSVPEPAAIAKGKDTRFRGNGIVVELMAHGERQGLAKGRMT